MSSLGKLALGIGLVLVTQVVPSRIQAQAPLIQITSPTDGALANSGQTLTITVSADPSLQTVGVISEDPLLGAVQPGSGPNQFSLTIPMTTKPGIYHLTAVAVSSAGPVYSTPVSLDVERSDDPLGGLEVQPGVLQFDFVGDQGTLRVIGTFLDGTSLDLTNSSRTVYSSNDTTVVTVSANGIATATGPGQTAIIVQQGKSSLTNIFYPVIVNVPGPFVNGVSPSSGTVGTNVTIDGSGFGPTQGNGDSVTFGGVTATPTSWTVDTIKVPVPSGVPAGNVNVVVTVAGFPSNSATFTMVGPTINSLSPADGPSGVGLQVTIAGGNFGATQGNNSTVTFGGLAANVLSWSDGSIATQVPTGLPAGPASVVVTANNVASGPASFTVIPSITGVSSSSGPVGTSITVTGTSFGTTQGTSSTITFNGTAGAPTSWGDTSILVPVPNGASTGPIVATVNGTCQQWCRVHGNYTTSNDNWHIPDLRSCRYNGHCKWNEFWKHFEREHRFLQRSQQRGNTCIGGLVESGKRDGHGTKQRPDRPREDECERAIRFGTNVYGHTVTSRLFLNLGN